jgi:hypothetical protein
MPRALPKSRTLRALAALSILFTLQACSAPGGSTPDHPESRFDPERSQGESWEVVLSGPAALAADFGPGFEYSRSDARLGAQEWSLQPLDFWPSADQPSLDNYRSLQLPSNPGRIIYFRSYR